MGRPPKKYHFTTVHHYDDFEIEESDWNVIERDSNYKFSKSIRSKILGCTQHFLSMAEAERNSPPLYANKRSKRSAAEARLNKIRSHANSLRNVLNEIEDYTSDDPALSADDLIGMNCERPELGGKAMPPKARFCTLQLAKILNDFVAACDEASRELKIFERADLFKQDNAWRKWAATISNILTKKGFRVSTTPNKSGQSNFVRLIRALHKRILIEALHKRIPPNLVPKRSTDDALEKAIQRAIHQKT